VVGDWQGNNWFITEGLKSGEVVVVDGGLSLQADAPVKIKTEASAAEPAPAGAAPKADTGKTEAAKGEK
jgi:membrane fusion protein (multidrug efflux system)